MMKSVKSEMASLTHSTTNAVDELKTQAKEVWGDVQRIESNLNTQSAEHSDTRARLSSLRSEFADLKKSSIHGRSSSARSTIGSNTRRRTVNETWTLTQVFVSRFCAFGTNGNARSIEKRGEKAAELLSHILATLRACVTVEKK